MSESFNVRRAVFGDEVLLRALRVRALTESPEAFGSTLERELARTTEDWQRWMSPGVTFILDRAGAAVGIVAGQRDPDDPNLVQLMAMWVDPSARSAGGGDALVSAIVEWAAAEGAKTVSLQVIKTNARAIRFYERQGFQMTGHELAREKDGQIESRMQRPAATRRALAWWVPILLTIHGAEEALTFKEYLPRLATLLPAPLAPFAAQVPYSATLLALVAVSVLASLVAAWVWITGHRRAWWALLALEATMALNVFAHVLIAMLIFHGYAPGLITAIVINAPFAIYFFRRAVRERWVSPAALRATLPAALLLHGPVLIALLWFAGRLMR